jgi:hypothetical protein
MWSGRVGRCTWPCSREWALRSARCRRRSSSDRWRDRRTFLRSRSHRARKLAGKRPHPLPRSPRPSCSRRALRNLCCARRPTVRASAGRALEWRLVAIWARRRTSSFHRFRTERLPVRRANAAELVARAALGAATRLSLVGTGRLTRCHHTRQVAIGGIPITLGAACTAMVLVRRKTDAFTITASQAHGARRGAGACASLPGSTRTTTVTGSPGTSGGPALARGTSGPAAAAAAAAAATCHAAPAFASGTAR